MTQLSFIGTGTMGAAMARRLCEAGHDVGVWNRSAATADAVVAHGATRLTLDVALRRPTVFSMLSNDAAVEAVFTEEALTQAPDGMIHVAMESLSLKAADRAAERHAAAGVIYLAAPVIGRPPVAAAGRLNILVAGAREALDQVSPVLDVLGSKTWYFGDQPRNANLVKICVNYNLIHTLQALAESVTMAERGGIDPAQFVEVLTSTLYPGPAYTGYGSSIATREYQPVGFSVALGLKDLSLAEQAAADNHTALPTSGVLREMFERTLADPALAGLDWAAIAETVRATEA